MRKNIIRVLLLAFTITFFSFVQCSNSTEPSAGGSTGERTGAVCNDGTTSSATGQGACSHHGGVDYWLCK